MWSSVNRLESNALHYRQAWRSISGSFEFFKWQEFHRQLSISVESKWKILSKKNLIYYLLLIINEIYIFIKIYQNSGSLHCVILSKLLKLAKSLVVIVLGRIVAILANKGYNNDLGRLKDYCNKIQWGLFKKLLKSSNNIWAE